MNMTPVTCNVPRDEAQLVRSVLVERGVAFSARSSPGGTRVTFSWQEEAEDFPRLDPDRPKPARRLRASDPQRVHDLEGKRDRGRFVFGSGAYQQILLDLTGNINRLTEGRA